MYLMRELGGFRFQDWRGTGRQGPHHGDVCLRQVADMIESDDRIRRQVLQLREQLIG
jgi:hypothetical protein